MIVAWAQAICVYLTLFSLQSLLSPTENWHRDALALCSDSWEAVVDSRIPTYKDPCTTISQNGPWDYNESWLLGVRFFAMREEKEGQEKVLIGGYFCCCVWVLVKYWLRQASWRIFKGFSIQISRQKLYYQSQCWKIMSGPIKIMTVA